MQMIFVVMRENVELGLRHAVEAHPGMDAANARAAYHRRKDVHSVYHVEGIKFIDKGSA